MQTLDELLRWFCVERSSDAGRPTALRLEWLGLHSKKAVQILLTEIVNVMPPGVRYVGGLGLAETFVPALLLCDSAPDLDPYLQGFRIRTDAGDEGVEGVLRADAPACLLVTHASGGEILVDAVTLARRSRSSDIRFVLAVIDHQNGARERLEQSGITLIALRLYSDVVGQAVVST